MEIELVSALEKRNNQRLLENNLYSKLLRKKLIFLYLLLGKTNFSRAFWSLLPEGLRKKDIIDLDSEIICRHILKNRIGDFVNIFDKKIFFCPENTDNKYPHLFALLATVNQIINLDQYKILTLIKDGSNIIDVGCNIGIFSLFANKTFPNSNIYSFEPNNITFKILKRTIDINNLNNNINIFNCALGDKEGNKKLRISKDALASGSAIADSQIVSEKNYFSSESVNVNITTIDKFVIDKNIKKVDFIKIDSEGYEKNILLGAKNTIQKFNPTIVCSAYHLKDDKTEIPDLIKSLFKDYGFEIENRVEKILIAKTNQKEI